MPPAYLFDLDGTLIDSLPGIQSALQQAFAAIHHPFPNANLRSTIGPPIRTIAKHLDPTLTDQQTLTIEQHYRPLYDNQTWRQTTLFPGVLETLTTLAQRNHPLHILTNKPTVPTAKILAHLNLTHLFTSIHTRNPTHPTKSALLTYLLQTQYLHPHETIMVGDTAEDAHAAQANQVPFLFATHGYGTPPPGTRTIASLQDLLTA